MNYFLFPQGHQNVNHLMNEVANFRLTERPPPFDHIIEGLYEDLVTPRGQSSIMM